MTLSSFAAYIKQLWRNKPDTSTPVTAERLAHMEEGIKGNSDAIEEIAAAVVSQIINDPDKIASMAAVYAVNQKVATLDGKVGDTAQLPDGATDVVTAIAKQNSNLARIITGTVLSQPFDCVANSEIDLTFSEEFPSVPKEIFASITSQNDKLTSYEICSVSIISRSQYAIRLKCNYNNNRKGDVVRCYYIAIL